MKCINCDIEFFERVSLSNLWCSKCLRELDRQIGEEMLKQRNQPNYIIVSYEEYKKLEQEFERLKKLAAAIKQITTQENHETNKTTKNP